MLECINDILKCYIDGRLTGFWNRTFVLNCKKSVTQKSTHMFHIWQMLLYKTLFWWTHLVFFSMFVSWTYYQLSLRTRYTKSYLLRAFIRHARTIRSFVKNELVIAFLISHAGTDIHQAIIRGLWCHQTLRGGVIWQHDVLQWMLRVIAHRLYADTRVVLLPARNITGTQSSTARYSTAQRNLLQLVKTTTEPQKYKHGIKVKKRRLRKGLLMLLWWILE